LPFLLRYKSNLFHLKYLYNCTTYNEEDEQRDSPPEAGKELRKQCAKIKHFKQSLPTM